MKKEIKYRIPVNAPVHQHFDLSFFEGNIETIIANLREIPLKHKEFINTLKKNNELVPRGARVTIDPHLDLIDEYKFVIDKYSWENTVEVSLNFYRWETDEELEKRIETNRTKSLAQKKAAKTRAKNQEIEERELLAKLKLKYKE